MLSVGAKLAVTATLPLPHHHHHLLLLVITMNTATIALLSKTITVLKRATATNVLGLGQRMTQWNGIHQKQLVGVSHRTQIRTRSLTQLIMNLEMIA